MALVNHKFTCANNIVSFIHKFCWDISFKIHMQFKIISYRLRFALLLLETFKPAVHPFEILPQIFAVDEVFGFRWYFNLYGIWWRRSNETCHWTVFRNPFFVKISQTSAKFHILNWDLLLGPCIELCISYKWINLLLTLHIPFRTHDQIKYIKMQKCKRGNFLCSNTFWVNFNLNIVWQ